MLGGHIENKETAEEALKREAYEEGGFLLDSCGMFVYRKVIASQPVVHPQPDQSYPFPISYMTYY